MKNSINQIHWYGINSEYQTNDVKKKKIHVTTLVLKPVNQMWWNAVQFFLHLL